VELPVDIGLMTSLEHLRVNNNRLLQLPVSVSALSRLRRITFTGNPLINIPSDFPERATDVRQYLSSLQEDPVPNNTVKLVVVGQEAVGKTSLLKAIKRTFWIIPHRYFTLVYSDTATCPCETNCLIYIVSHVLICLILIHFFMHVLAPGRLNKM